MNILASLVISYDDLTKTCKDPETLEEIKRKQNERESLTNVTDKSFDFCSTLEILCRKKLVPTNLMKYGKNLFSFVVDELLSSKELFDLWVQTLTHNYNIKYESQDSDNIDNIIQSLTLSCENYLVIFQSAVVILESLFQSISKRLFNFS